MRDDEAGRPETLAVAARFEPVPLPSLPPGELTASRLNPVLREWVSSAPLRELAAASGWGWPDSPRTAELLDGLAHLSSGWDFRHQRERNFIGAAPAEVNGRIVPEDLITAAATALGLVRAAPLPDTGFSHMVVLSGLVSACVNRTRHAAELLRTGLDAESTIVLGAHRALGGEEPEQARLAGLGDLFDEADAVVAATRQAFALGDPEQSEESGPRRADWDDALRGASARYRWMDIEVIIAPSAEPSTRRANTPDQLHNWAELAGIGVSDRVLLLTTQIYVLFQQLVGLRLLGLERGCSVLCCGVVVPTRQFSGREYLQEIRSALLAASELMAAAQRRDG